MYLLPFVSIIILYHKSSILSSSKLKFFVSSSNFLAESSAIFYHNRRASISVQRCSKPYLRITLSNNFSLMCSIFSTPLLYILYYIKCPKKRTSHFIALPLYHTKAAAERLVQTNLCPGNKHLFGNTLLTRT